MTEPVLARLKNGELIGARDHSVCRFSAIPYAQPPTGPLRFRPPQPAVWSGRRHADQPGPVCPQLPSRLRSVMGDFTAEHNEDCLHLTVWTPAVDNHKRPVVVWLHGGAWQSGGGAIDWYNGAQLSARGDVVVVAVNYRLAALGWLFVPGETANCGLLDTEMAIDWVCSNIADLGGDPDRITVMGQSAGGFNIAALLTRTPRFQRAILQSASLGRGFRSAEQAERLTHAFLESLHAPTLEAARALPTDALLKAQHAPGVLDALALENANRSLFCPVADGEIIATDCTQALHDAVARADVLIGATRDEMAAFPGQDCSPASRALGDEIFGAPSRRWADHARQKGRQAWSYSFDFGPHPHYGACHCIELPFTFGNLDAFRAAPMLEGADPAHARVLADAVQRAWIAFIRGENPGWAPAPHVHHFA